MAPSVPSPASTLISMHVVYALHTTSHITNYMYQQSSLANDLEQSHLQKSDNAASHSTNRSEQGM